MLCPEISNFPPPKVYVYHKKIDKEETGKTRQIIEMNNFYKSLIVTCPDEHNMKYIQKIVTHDTDYYKLLDCPLTEFINPNFIKYFIMNGKVTCLSDHKNCIVQNCAAITPEGTLTINVLESVYQTLGIEGTKRPYGYYEIKIDLTHLKRFAKIKDALTKLDINDFYLTWEPNNEMVCPSSIAKYLHERGVTVSSHCLTFEMLTPEVTQIPILENTEGDCGTPVNEIVEWMGMLAIKGDMAPTEDYISTYTEPDCQNPIPSTRISILIAKGFVTPVILKRLSDNLSQNVGARDVKNYWMALSIQGMDECLWQVSPGSPRMFQSHNSSCNIFYTHRGCVVYSIGQLKYV